MKKKDKKYVIVSQRLHPSQINELSICCFIVKKENNRKLFDFIVNNGGRVVSDIRCSGIPRRAAYQSINSYVLDEHLVIATCQKEIMDIFMLNICREFDFNKEGNGKAFVLDVLGYMGAKGPFIE